MRLAALVLSSILALAVATDSAGASERVLHEAPPPVLRGVDVDINDNGDDVVEVQVVVLGIVIGSVFILGTAAWMLRRQLGLTAYTPPADDGHH